ncbi:hypothetical protein D3C84_859850 [compost metagenome]
MLDDAVDRGGQSHQAVTLFGLFQFLDQGRDRLGGFMLQVEHRATGLGQDALSAMLGFPPGSRQFLQPRLLHLEFALLFQPCLLPLQPGMLADNGLVQQLLVVG